MKAVRVTIGLLAVLIIASFSIRRNTSPEQEIAQLLNQQIASFDSLVGGPFMQAVRQNAGQQALQQLFLQSRLSYKQWEWAAAYFNPVLDRKLNGAPVPEMDPQSEPDISPEQYNPYRFRITEPEGLQVIEGLLFPRYDTTQKDTLLHYLQELQQAARQYEVRFKNIGILPGQVLDAAKLEIFRLLTLGITGFDNPLSLRSMEESAAALDGLRRAISCYRGQQVPQAPFNNLLQQLTTTAAYLRHHTDFNSFDRAYFITHFGNPLSRSITQLISSWQVPVIRYRRLLRQDAATLFDTGAFDADAYTTAAGEPTTPALVQLGQQLFYEPALSVSGKRSCASCHEPDKAFTDGLPRNNTVDGHGLVARNTPTLLNAALQPAFFDDMRSITLEDQARDVLHNPTEMHASLQTAIRHIQADSSYRSLLQAAFPGATPVIQDTFWIPQALAAYVRSLVRLNSRFDQYMQGDSTALTAGEIKGFNLFMGKARCATCHYMPLFNGNVPPMYNRMEAEVIGTPAVPDSPGIDADPGRFAFIRTPLLLHAFKTPGIRDAARTGPYMHNGVFSSLEQVIDFYDAGGGAGQGAHIPNQTLSTDSLYLSATEKTALIEFIQSLNSR